MLLGFLVLFLASPWKLYTLLFIASVLGGLHLWRQRTHARFRSRAGVCVITGASAGIGAQMALQLATHGNKTLVLAARSVDKLTDVASKCRKAGASRVLVHKCDVSADQDVRGLVRYALEECERIDVLILNAGIAQAHLLRKARADVIARFTDVNYLGVVRPIHEAIEALTASRGRVAIVSSVAGYVPMAFGTLYHGSKFGLEGFGRALRQEMLPEGVSVTMINPGFIATNMAQGGALTPEGKPSGPSKSLSGTVRLMSATECARQSVEAIGARRYSLMLPWWYRVLSILYQLFPEAFEWAMSKAMVKKSRGKKKQ